MFIQQGHFRNGKCLNALKFLNTEMCIMISQHRYGNSR